MNKPWQAHAGAGWRLRDAESGGAAGGMAPTLRNGVYDVA